MNGLREKFRNKKGFTLIEMLIVVAIIAILIAVSIPLVGNALDRARHATDAANERAAKAELSIQYLAGDNAAIYSQGGSSATLVANEKIVADGKTTYYYDAANGRLAKASTGIDPYGQCTNGGNHTTTANGILALTMDENGTVNVYWGSSASGTTLCGTAKDVKHS